MFEIRYEVPHAPTEADYASIASIRDLGELNRLMSLVPDTGVGFDVLLASYRWESIKGYMFPAEQVLRLAGLLGLLYSAGGSLYRTSFGSKFHSLNHARVYELSGEQMRILVEYLLYSPNPITRRVDEILFGFKYSRSRKRYEYSLRDYGPIPVQRALLFLLHSLRILIDGADGILYVDPSLTPDLASKIRRWREGRQDRNDLDAAKLEVARHAELLALGYEQTRLRSVGRADLASLVEVVAEYDCTVGYDILSFDGKRSAPENPDRFIEVKSTSSDRFHFYLSETELSVSRRHGSMYWIYHLSRVARDSKLDHCVLRRIRNPAVAILNPARFEFSADSLHVQGVSKGLGPQQRSES